MAVNNTASTYSKMEFPMAIQRQDAFSLDPTECWASMADALDYAQNNPTAYVGQEIVVMVDGVPKRYMITDTNGTLVATGGVSDDDIATDTEVAEMMATVFSTTEDTQTVE